MTRHNKLTEWETVVPSARVGLAGSEASRKSGEQPFLYERERDGRSEDENIVRITMQAHLGFANKKEMGVLQEFVDEQKPGADAWTTKLTSEYKQRGARWYPPDERMDIKQALLWCYLRNPSKNSTIARELSESITEFDMFGWLTKPGQQSVLAYKQRGLAIRTQEVFINVTHRAARYSMEARSILRKLHWAWSRKK